MVTSLQLMDMDSATLPEESAEDVKLALGSGRRLMDMITAILDVSKMESGQMSLNLEPTDLAATARAALQTLSNLVRNRDVRLEVEEEVVLAHDPQLTERVIANLLSNALRYTPNDGTVTVRVARVEGGARLEVRDEGPGVPEEHRERIFEKFGQLEAREQGVATTGLGLAFCKLAVEAHGGTIGVDSEMGSGSTFWFELPTTDG